MANTTTFPYVNGTVSTKTIAPRELGVVTNYALIADEPTKVVFNNKTCPLDRPEFLAYKCQNIGKVNTSIPVQYPSKVTAGIQYSVTLEEVLTTTSSTDASYRVDEPLVITIGIRHQKSSNITDTLVQEAFERALGALRKADGTYRFKEMMRSALKPTVD